MSKHHSRVQIVNPVPGGNDSTSVDRAKRFVRNGRAEFVSPLVIRFLDKPLHRRLNAEAVKQIEKTIAQNTGYDRTGGVFFDDARHIPIVNAAKMIREERSPRNWSYYTGVRRSVTRDHSAAEVAAIRRGPVRSVAPNLLGACAGAV